MPFQTEAHKPGLGEHDRVEILLDELAQPRIDVAADLDQLEIGPAMQDLGSPPQAARGNDGAGRELGERRMARRDEHVAGRSSRRHGGERKLRHDDRRQILEAVNGDLDPALEERVLDRLREDPFAAEAGERHGLHLVAGRLDQGELDAEAGMRRAQPIGDVMGLPERQRTAARADAERRHVGSRVRRRRAAISERESGPVSRRARSARSRSARSRASHTAFSRSGSSVRRGK